MRQWRFVVALALLLAMIALAATNVARVSRSTGDVAPTASAAFVSPDQPLTLEAAYGTAASIARENLMDSALMFASLQADWPLDDQQPGPPVFPPGGWARFAFVGQDGGETRLLSVEVERYSGQVTTAELQPWDSSNPAPLPVGMTAVTSDAALLIAEESDGQAFRLECPVDRHESEITLVGPTSPRTGPAVMATPTAAIPATATPVPDATPLGTSPLAAPLVAAGNGSVAHWLVTYRDGRQPGRNSLELEIEATSGQVLAVRDRRQPCDGGG